MSKSCCVPFCTSKTTSKEVSFHEIPSDMKVREQWLKNISRGDPENTSLPWIPGERSLVCSRHFVESDYSESDNRRRLKRTSVPMIFPEYPKYKQPKITKSRIPPRRRPFGELSQNRNNRKITGNKSAAVRAVQPDLCDGNLTCDMDQTTNIFQHNKSTQTVSAERRSVTVDLLREHLEKLKREKTNLIRTIKRRDLLIKNLQAQLKTSKSKESPLCIAAKIIEKAADTGNTKAILLHQQILAYGKSRFLWSEFCLRMCVLWRNKSPKSYAFARKRFLNLPGATTLQRYVGPSCLETGISSLCRKRLEEELRALSEHETFCSLIFDEMAIQPKMEYRRQADKIIGVAENWKKVTGAKPQLANRLLCFVLKGLSTNYRIPVAYFLVRQLSSKDLSQLILNVINQVTQIGFQTCRLVCDDAAVNVKALVEICNGTLQHKINHPFIANWPLYISFDPCHILKNLRNQLLDDDRILKNKEGMISGKPIKILYESQKMLTVKSVRFLSRKMVYPTNFEKMNVKRAIRIFSDELIGALEYCNERQLKGFRDIEETILFMKFVQKWFTIHNICNRSHYIHCRNEDKMHFWMVEDKRLEWLETDFLGYFDSWKNFALNGTGGTKLKSKTTGFLTMETFTALRITTLATVDCIRYLISSGFHYVLTRKFTSDDIEGLFSAVRSSLGGNDQATAAGSIYALETILKTGIFSSSIDGNQFDPEAEDLTEFPKKTNVLERVMPTPSFVELSNEQKQLLSLVSNPPSIRVVSTKMAGTAMIAGFLLRLLKDKHPCPRAGEFITAAQKEDQVNQLIALQDRGGLQYPSKKFVSFVNLILSILELSNEHYYQQALVESWKLTFMKLLPMKCISCGCGTDEHEKLTKELILKSLCKIYFNNISFCNTDLVNDKPKFSNKPMSKKVKKL